MRVALDATPLLGPRTGVGTYVWHLLRGLTELADPPDLVATAFTARGGEGLHDEVPPGVTVRSRRAPARLLRTAWLAGAGPVGESLVGDVDVFHGTNFVVPPLRRAAGLVTVHDLVYLHRPDTVTADSLAYRELVPLALRRGAHVATPSRAVADQVLDAYAVSPDRVHVTPLGVDPAWAQAGRPSPHDRSRLHLPASYVVTVGTMEPRKNLATLVAAYRLGVGRGLDLPPLVVAGPAGWGPELDTSGIPEHLVVRVGRLALDDLRLLVAGADALVFPSLDEGFGLPPLEALACGTAVVASDLPVTREVLGSQALYVDPHSAEQLLDGVLRSLDAPTGSVESRRAHASAFTWGRCADATLDAYRRAAADHESR